jgi:VanZ family protein
MIRLIIALKPFGKYLMIGWMVTILTVSSLPSLPTPKLKLNAGKVEIRLDYIIHFCEYGALAFLVFLSFVNKEFILLLRKYLFLTSMIILFALLDEFHQKLIPGRSFNPKDILSNISGVMAGLIFCYFMFRKIARGFKRL